MRRILLAAIICFAMASHLAWADDTPTDPFGFAGDSYSTWGITNAAYPFDPAQAEAGDYGCFPVGNGLVFAHLGVDGDFNTLRGITGPGYQTRSDSGKAVYWQPGNWPDLTTLVIRPDGSPIPWTIQNIETIRGAAMVRTIQRNHVHDLFTLTYAANNEPLIVREYLLFGPRESLEAAMLQLTPAGPDAGWCTNGQKQLAVYSGSTRVDTDALPLVLDGSIERIDGQTVKRWTVYLYFTQDDPPESGVLPGSPDQYCTDTYRQWMAYSAGNQQFDTGDPMMDDLMIQLPVIIEAQRDHYSGGVAPMVSYHGYWVRDSIGPILTYLDNHRFDTVMRMLRYHRAACLNYGWSHMLVPLDLDLSGLVDWEPGEEGTAGDLSGIGVEPELWEGTPVESAEVPSLIVLQHYWLWRSMLRAGFQAEADAFIKEAWAFIRHNLVSMEYHPEYGVYFHGDETYTNGSLYSTYDNEESGLTGYPNGYIPTDGFTSLDNTLLHLAAADAMAFMADSLERKEDVVAALRITSDLEYIIKRKFTYQSRFTGCAISTATGQCWYPPFANISLRPFWLDIIKRNLPPATTYARLRHRLWNEPYPMTTPWSGYFTGNSLGYWLTAATAVGDRAGAGECARLLKETASPEGAWCEVYNPAGKPVDIYGRTNRIRPWESGINYHALLSYYGPGNAWQDPPLEYDSAVDPPIVSAPDGTQVLVLTVSDGWWDFVIRDNRFKDLPEDAVCAWDAGLPFSIGDLRAALLNDDVPDQTGEPPSALRIPYLFIDREVTGGLSRRTFKQEYFWEGWEMEELLRDYRRAGGTVVDEDSMDLMLAGDEVVTLRQLIVLYPNTFTHRMSPEEIETFHREMAEWACWMDDAAGDRLSLSFDFLQVNTKLPPRLCGPQGNDTYWMDCTSVEQDLLDRRIPKDYYDSVCCFWAWDRDAVLADGSQPRQAYGGAAQGPDDGMEFLGRAGRTSYFGSAVLKSHPGRTSKNATHEYLHNTDAMLEMVGESRMFHTDHMSKEMETVLAEIPGGFEDCGFTDEEMRGMVEAELRNEIHYPWRTQLVFYKQGIQRIPAPDYGQLLKLYGKRAKRTPRHQLYQNYFLPVGVDPYQVDFTGLSDLPGVVLEEYDFVDKDYLISRIECWAGTLPAKTVSGRRYHEVAIDCPEAVTFVLGKDMGPLRVELLDLGETDEGLPMCDVWMEWDGGRQTLYCVGDYAYVCPIPEGMQESEEVYFKARIPGCVAMPMPMQLNLEPAWDLIMDITDDPTTGAGIRVRIEGPPGEYDVAIRAVTPANTIRGMLEADGVLTRFEGEFTATLPPNTDLEIGLGETDIAPLLAARTTATVTHRSGTGIETSYVHHIPPVTGFNAELMHGITGDVPFYIPRAFHLTPVIDGNLNDWGAISGLRLTPENCNVYSGEIEDAADCSVEISLGYDADYLYVGGIVTDDMVTGRGTWDSDRINLVFDAGLNSTADTYPGGAVGHTGWERDDFWVLLIPMQPGGPETVRLGGEVPQGGKNGYYGPVTGARAEVVQGEGGYTFEWSIPLDALPYLEPQAGWFTGFTLFISDYDEKLSEMMYLTDWGSGGDIEWRFWDCGLLYFHE